MSTERDELAAMRGELAELTATAAERDDDDWMTEAATAILAAGYRKPFDLSPGFYMNRLGVEIEVMGLEAAPHTIGSLWSAYQHDDLFPRRLTVTAEGMRDAGYSRVEAPSV